MLTVQEQKTFDRDGYVVLRQILSKSLIESARTAIAEAADTKIRALHAAGEITDTFEEASFETRWALVCRENNLTPPRQWGGGTGMLCPAIYNLYVDAHLTSAMAQLLGPELTAHGDFWVRPNIGGNSRLGWHQDSHYYGASAEPRFKVFNAWVPFVDVDEENGCLQLVRGSHHFGLVPATRETPKALVELTQDPSHYGTVAGEPMQSGDVLILTNLTLHASGYNQTDQVRWSVDLRFSPSGQSTDWHKIGKEIDKHFPNFIAHSSDPSRVMSWKQWQDKWRNRPEVS